MSAETKTPLPIAFLSLFFSLGTLLCCAIPALLVSIGLGATLAGIASSAPHLVWLSENKDWVFGLAFVSMCVAGFAIFNSRNAPCPIDPRLRNACIKGRLWSFRIFMITVLCFFTGAFFAYLAPLI